MFCPECGMEDKQANQFCRACGTDLREIRAAFEAPDSITASAASARQELGRAVAMKIREIEDTDELKTVTEDVLPEIEKFLESPEEKRLRRMRTGVILASIGIGAAVGISAVSLAMKDSDVIFLAGLGIVTFFIGLGFILNGVLLTVPRSAVPDRSPDARRQRQMDDAASDGSPTTNDLKMPLPAGDGFTSVTEPTTQHLYEKRSPAKRQEPDLTRP